MKQLSPNAQKSVFALTVIFMCLIIIAAVVILIIMPFRPSMIYREGNINDFQQPKIKSIQIGYPDNEKFDKWTMIKTIYDSAEQKQIISSIISDPNKLMESRQVIILNFKNENIYFYYMINFEQKFIYGTDWKSEYIFKYLVDNKIIGERPKELIMPIYIYLDLLRIINNLPGNKKQESKIL